MQTGLFQWLGNTIDSALATFVFQTSSTLAATITPLVTTGLTIWVLVYGLAVMRNEVGDPVNVFVWKAIKLSAILFFALAAGAYQGDIVGAVYDGIDGLSAALAPNKAGNVYGLLDGYESKSLDLVLTILSHAVDLLPMGGWLDLLAGAVLALAVALTLIFCGGFVIFAKIALAIVLALGPLFIAALAFAPLQKFFDAWLGTVLNYVLLIVVLATFVTLSITIGDHYLASFANQEDAAQAFASALGMLTLSGAMLVVLWQAPSIAASLAGASALAGLGLGRLGGHYVVDKLAFTRKGSSRAAAKSKGSGNAGGSKARPGRVPAYRQATLNHMAKKRR